MAGRPLRRARMNPARTIEQFLASLTPKQVESIEARVEKVVMENGGWDFSGQDKYKLAEALILTHRGIPITRDNLENLQWELRTTNWNHGHPEWDQAYEWSDRYYRR